jgi:glycosyltransferase involved in cell wall biosynthesis
MVTPIPVDEAWFQPADPGISPVAGPYLLYVGNTKWHKNLPLLLTAYADVAHDIPHKLVIAGSGESLRAGDDRVAALAAEQGDRVQVMGRLDFDVLRSLVAGADLLVMPSLHEGAGLPPIEAMASRTAVLASDIASLRETCGDGADYFDPHDHRALAALLRTYAGNGSATADLAARGWSHVTARQSGISFDSAAEAVATELAASRP